MVKRLTYAIEVSIDCGIQFHNFNYSESLVQQLLGLLDLFLWPCTPNLRQSLAYTIKTDLCVETCTHM